MTYGIGWDEKFLALYLKGQKQARDAALGGKAKRANKYSAVRVGDSDSKKEDKRLQELKLLQIAGEINDLKHHVAYPLHVNGMLICNYEADFTYNLPRTGKPAVFVVEDAKGVHTDVYKLKKKLMKAIHGIEIYET